MRRKVSWVYSVAGLLLAILSVIGIFLTQPATAQIPHVPYIGYDQTIPDEVRSARGTEHTFTGCVGEVISLAVEANDFAPRIELYPIGSNQPPLASAVAIGSSASAISRGVVLEDVTLPASGTYTILVSGRSRIDRGSYSLTLEGRAAAGSRLDDGTVSFNLAHDQAVTGNISAARADQWNFRACEGDAIRAQLDTDGFAPKLTLYAPNAEFPIATAAALEANVDGTRALLRRTLPETGTYRLVAGGMSRSDAGNYELALMLESSATPTATPAAGSTAASTSTTTATPTPRATSRPNVRRGLPTVEATPAVTRQPTAPPTNATRTPTPELIMPGMGAGAFRIIDVYSIGGPVNHVVYAPDGDSFATAGEDGAVRIWNAFSGTPLDTFEGHNGRVNYIAYAPDGDLLASAADDGTVRLWDASGVEVAQLDMPDNSVKSVAFNAEGDKLVAATGAGDVLIWDVSGISSAGDASEDATAEDATVEMTLAGHDEPVYAALFSPDGTLIATGDAAGVVRIWQVASGELRDSFPVNRGPDSGDPILSIAFSQDGSTIVAGGVMGVNDASVQIWDIEAGEPIGALAGHGEWGSSAVVSPDDAYILSAGRNDPQQDGPSPATVRLWNAESGELRIALLGYPSSVVAATFRPDGEELLSSDGTTVYIWPAAMIKIFAAAFAGPVAVEMPVPEPGMGGTLDGATTPASTRTPTPTHSPSPTATATVTPTITSTTTATITSAVTPTVTSSVTSTVTPAMTPVVTSTSAVIASSPMPPASPTRAPVTSTVPSTITSTLTSTLTSTVTSTVTPVPTAPVLLTPTFLPFVADAEIYCTVVAWQLNLRAGPGTSFDPPLTMIANGQLLLVTGRNTDASWLQVALLDEDMEPEINGWVSANFVFCVGDVTSAPVVEGVN